MSTYHRAAKAAAATALALAAGTIMATVSASAAPAYLSMTSEIRMTPADSSRTDGGYFNEQVIYINGVVSMSKAAAQDTIDHNENTIALRYWGDDTNDDDLLSVRSIRRRCSPRKKDCISSVPPRCPISSWTRTAGRSKT